MFNIMVSKRNQQNQFLRHKYWMATIQFDGFSFFPADSLEAFGKICLQLLQDVQERLVFRAHLYLQSDILNYKPSPGDLAYPEKLEMMEVSLKEHQFSKIPKL